MKLFYYVPATSHDPNYEFGPLSYFVCAETPEAAADAMNRRRAAANEPDISVSEVKTAAAGEVVEVRTPS